MQDFTSPKKFPNLHSFIYPKSVSGNKQRDMAFHHSFTIKTNTARDPSSFPPKKAFNFNVMRITYYYTLLNITYIICQYIPQLGIRPGHFMFSSKCSYPLSHRVALTNAFKDNIHKR